MRKTMVLMSVLALTAPVMAGGVWNEDGDAPELLPGQAVIGAGNLAEIFGRFDAGSDVDLYQIMITDADAFSASTVDRCDCDTQLFLFDADGFGVTHDDDNEVPGVGLTSLITGRFVTGPGLYYLAVTQYNNDPATAANQLIWNNTPFRAERAPDGPGAAGALDHWQYAFGSVADYSIGLTGAGFVPAPGSLALLGLAGVFGRRRRKA